MRARIAADIGAVLSAYAAVAAIRFDVPELLGPAVLCFVIAIYAAAMEQLLHEGVEEVGKVDEGHETESLFLAEFPSGK